MIATQTRTFSSREAARLADVSYHQADYWCRLGLMAPLTPASGSGSRRRYSTEDVLAMRVVRVLMTHRVRHETIREVLGLLHSPKPLLWVRGRTATVGDAFDFLAESETLDADEAVLVVSPEVMLRAIEAEVPNLG